MSKQGMGAQQKHQYVASPEADTAWITNSGRVLASTDGTALRRSEGFRNRGLEMRMMSMKCFALVAAVLGGLGASCMDSRPPTNALGENAGESSGDPTGPVETSGDGDDGEPPVGEPQYERCEDAEHCEGSEAAHVEDLGSDPPPDPYEPAPPTPCSPDDPNAGQDPLCRDRDGDGTKARWDCDDSDPTRYHLAFEIACDGIDQNCDGTDYCDRDHDAWADAVDCEPVDPRISGQCYEQGEPEHLD